MVKIYTKTGDNGDTSLFSGKRVSKSDPRIEAIGAVDEINATLGICAAETKDAAVRTSVQEIQNKLFEIGAELANPEKVGEKFAQFNLNENDVQLLESLIDKYDKVLPKLNQFILPGGSRGAAYFHLARSTTRRAERYVTQLAE